jgi:hypothetical protein
MFDNRNLLLNDNKFQFFIKKKNNNNKFDTESRHKYNHKLG